MHDYNIYKRSTGEMQVVKKGWSWPAFFFSWIWAFAKGLNSLGAGLLISGMILGAALGVATSGSQTGSNILTLACLAAAIWLGTKGNAFVESKLMKNGFEFVGSVEATTSESAATSFSQGADASDSQFFCSDCGEEVFPGYAFCTSCGAPLEWDEDEERRHSGNYAAREDARQVPPSDVSIDPEAEKAKRYGKTLGLRGKVTVQDIRRNYKDLIAKYHPDKVQHLGEELQRVAETKTKEINEAYEYFKKKYSFD